MRPWPAAAAPVARPVMTPYSQTPFTQTPFTQHAQHSAHAQHAQHAAAPAVEDDGVSKSQAKRNRKKMRDAA